VGLSRDCFCLTFISRDKPAPTFGAEKPAGFSHNLERLDWRSSLKILGCVSAPFDPL
jgi:hypothetical protein